MQPPRRRHTAWLLQLPLLLCALTPCAPSTVAADTPAAPLAITGHLTTPTGTPLPDARVELVPLPDRLQRGRLLAAGAVTLPPVARTTSDADGRYHLTAPGPGLWGVVVGAAGHLPMVYDLVPLVEPTALPPVALQPDAGAAVRVVDPEGRPVTGARLRVRSRGDPLWSEARRAGWSPVRTFVQTRQDGTARLPRAAGEALRVAAWAPAWVESEGEVGAAEQGEVVLRLRHGVERVTEVRAPSGEPVTGATVVVGGPRGLQAGVTDGHGRLRIRARPGAAAELVVAAPGGLRGRFRLTPEADAGEPPEEGEADGGGGPPVVVLPLTPDVSLAGRVVDRGDGSPVAAAVVWNAEAPADWRRTGADGGFVLPEPEGEGVRLRAAAAGYLAADLRFRATVEQTPWTVALTPAVTLTGRVVDPAGTPVAGARVVVSRVDGAGGSSGGSGGRSGGRSRADVESGVDGMFRAGPLARGPTYELHVTAAGYAPAEHSVDSGAVRDAGAALLRVVLTPGGAVSGRVVRATGEPAAGAGVEVRPDRDPIRDWWSRRGDDGATATVDAAGRFRVADLAADLYELQVRDPASAPLSRHGIEVTAGRDTDLGLLTLEAGAVVEGEVVDAGGGPVAGARVEVHPVRTRLGSPERRPPLPAVETGADGGFRLGGLAPGEPVQVRVVADGGPEVLLRDVLPPTDAPLRVVLPAGAEVFGRVVETTGEGVAGAHVQALTRGEGDGASSHYTRRSGRSGGDGSFRLTGLSPGRLRLQVLAGGRSWMQEIADPLTAGERRGPLEIVLPGGATLAGRVLHADGTPAAGARVVVRRADGGVGGGAMAAAGRAASARARSTVADSSGTFRLAGLLPGAVRVESDLGRHGRASWDGELTAGGDGEETWVELRAEPQLYVAGRVRDAAGRPLVASVELRGAGPAAPRATGTDVVYEPGHAPPYVRNVRSARDGSFLVGDLPAGTFRLRVWAPDHVPWEAEGVLEVGPEPVDGLDVRLSGGAAVHGELLGVDGAEAGGVRVRAMGEGGGSGSQQVGRVSAAGRYRVDGLAPGEWHLFASMPRTGREASRRIEVRPGDELLEVDLDLGRGLVVEGELRVRGAVPRDALVVLQRLGGEGDRVAGAGATAPADSGRGRRVVSVPLLPDGRFRAEGLEPGRYALRLQGGFLGGSPSFLHHLEVASDRSVHQDFPAATVVGQVLDPAARPVPHATVRLHPVDGLPPGQSGAVTHADDDGSFAFPYVSPGRWRVEVVTREQAGATEVVAAAGTSVVEVTVR